MPQEVNTRILLIASGVLIFGAAACATAKPKPDLVWPPPPELPRIKHLKTFKDAESFGEEKPILDLLFGSNKAGGEGRLEKPYSAAAGEGGRVYVSDTGSGRVAVFDFDNKKVWFIGEASTGMLALPLGIAVGPDGLLYVCDGKQRRVHVYDREGVFVRVIGGPKELDRPSAIAIARDHDAIYVVDIGGHRVARYKMDGTFVEHWGKRGSGPGEFNFPNGVAVASDGTVYVLDGMNFRYQTFDRTGKPLAQYGKNCNQPGCFSKAKGIALDSKGHVYVSDAAFGNIQIFNDKGEILLFWGSSGNGDGQFALIAGISIDAKDRIYAVDQWLRRVQVFQYLDQPDATPATPRAEPAKPNEGQKPAEVTRPTETPKPAGPAKPPAPAGK